MLEAYLASYVQNPPYHLVASSLGCQIAVEYADRKPDQWDASCCCARRAWRRMRSCR